MSRPATCTACGVAPVAMRGAPYCFACWPGRPHTPPPCWRCGATSGYHSDGLCVRCHHYGDPHPDSCTDCYAWGVFRNADRLCVGCHLWRRRRPVPGPCDICHRMVALSEGVCRLCRRQGTLARPVDGLLNLEAANRHGQQLFIADLFHRHGTTAQRRAQTPEAAQWSPTQPAPRPLAHTQLLLFDMLRDLRAGRAGGFPAPADPVLAAYLDQQVLGHAQRHGWSDSTTDSTRRGMRLLLGLQDTPGARIKISDARLLYQIRQHSRPALDVLAAADMVHDDCIPPVVTWFTDRAADLPEPMRTELHQWFDVMHHGSRTPPRRKPKSRNTIRHQYSAAMPMLHTWVEAGHRTLRGITRDDILLALPTAAGPRVKAVTAMRSIFSILKSRKTIFINPATHLHAGPGVTNQPLPADLDRMRECLNSDDLLQAALTALIAFHALQAAQIRHLKTTDLQDGRLHLEDRVIVLATPVKVRIAAWLDHRNQRWPRTANPHLFLTRRSANQTTPMSACTIGRRIGMSAQRIREDRILDEAQATAGDARRLCDLFGLSISGAQRYTDTLDHPGITEYEHRAVPNTPASSRTHPPHHAHDPSPTLGFAPETPRSKEPTGVQLFTSVVSDPLGAPGRRPHPVEGYLLGDSGQDGVDLMLHQRGQGARRGGEGHVDDDRAVLVKVYPVHQPRVDDVDPQLRVQDVAQRFPDVLDPPVPADRCGAWVFEHRRVLHRGLRTDVPLDPLHPGPGMREGPAGRQVVDVGRPVLDRGAAHPGPGLGHDLGDGGVQGVGGVDGCSASLDVVQR